MRILSADWVVPVEGPPLRDGAVAIHKGRIVRLGPSAEIGEGERHPDSVILPGFVNAHSHLEYAVYSGFGDGFDFARWLALHVERKRLIGFEEMEAIARLGALACLRSGVTTVGDASFSGAAAPACDAVGLRALVYVEVFGDDGAIESRFAPARDRIASSLSDRVQLGVSPHAPYTCTVELYRACAELGLPVCTHLAESEPERDWLLSGSGPWQAFAELLVPPPGKTGIRLLAEAGLLGPHVLAAHCVDVDDKELDVLATHEVAVAHCPRSNALLGCGIAPVRKLLDRGVRVGLGTDSPASTPSFDMFEELRASVMLARARDRQPDALGAGAALALATIGAARALGLDDEIGSLAPGKQADLTVLSLAGSPFLPWEDPVTAAVLGGSPERVVATLVAGETRYEKGGETWPELTADAHSARGRLLSRAAAKS